MTRCCIAFCGMRACRDMLDNIAVDVGKGLGVDLSGDAIAAVNPFFPGKVPSSHVWRRPQAFKIWHFLVALSSS